MKKKTSKKPAAVRQPDRRQEWEDAMNDCCRNLITLGELLAEAGRNDVVLKSELVNNAGGLIEREARQLKTLLANHPQP